MATDAQDGANRRNATGSTGPRSAEGKRRVSRNAITHGLDCRETVLPHEDAAAFDDYRRAMLADNQPVGAQEQDCVEEMVSARWRLRRCWREQTQLYAIQRRRLGGGNADEAASVLNDLHAQKGFPYLDRKEAALNRHYLACSKRLQELQALRRRLERHVEEEEEDTVEPAAPVDASASSDDASGESAEQSQSAAGPSLPAAWPGPVVAANVGAFADVTSASTPGP